MSAVVICTGLAWGMLLAAVGLMLWDGRGEVHGLSGALQIITWSASAILMLGALMAWGGWFIGRGHRSAARGIGAILYLILVAASAVPLGIRYPQRFSWSLVMPFLPSIALAGVALFRASTSGGVQVDGTPVTVVGISMAVCAGLGARAMGGALQEMMTETRVKWPFAVTYVALTSIVAGTMLTNLWRYGTVWGREGYPMGGDTAAAWLAWSAAWLCTSRRPRLRAGLTLVAALTLISATVA